VGKGSEVRKHNKIIKVHLKKKKKNDITLDIKEAFQGERE